MAASPRTWKDNGWLVWFILSITACVLVDAVDLYPHSLWEPPNSPLHFLSNIRQSYLSEYNDPIIQWAPPAIPSAPTTSWVPLFMYLEVFFLLPTAVYAAYSLLPIGAAGRKRGTTGPQELLFLIYAFHSALTTLVCVYDVFWWDGAVYSREVKTEFVFKLYGPWLVVSTLLFVDMYSRLLGRFRAMDDVKKTQ